MNDEQQGRVKRNKFLTSLSVFIIHHSAFYLSPSTVPPR
jgi:hypothetical protein